MAIAPASVRLPARPSGPSLFDWLMTAGGGLLVAGFYLDGWAHLHGRNSGAALNPWHLLLYAGGAALAAVIIGCWLRPAARGLPWRSRLPRGYGLSALGVGGCALGVIGDAAWHRWFGVEVDVETLLSPPHLLLGASAALVAAGPLRAGIGRDGGSWRARLPGLLALAWLLSLLTFYAEFLHPVVNAWPGAGFMARYPLKRATPPIAQAIGIGGLLLHSGLLAGAALGLLRRGPLPRGGLTLLFGLNLGLLTVLRDEYRMLPMALALGLFADGLAAWLRPAPDRPAALRLFAAAIAWAFAGLYFLTLALTEGLAWSIHLWLGTWLLCGGGGWLLGWLAAPPDG